MQIQLPAHSRRAFISGVALAFGGLASGVYLTGFSGHDDEEFVHARLMLRPPGGQRLEGFDSSHAKTLPGILDVIHIDDALAIIASDGSSLEEASKRVIAQWKAGTDSNGGSKPEPKIRARSTLPLVAIRFAGDMVHVWTDRQLTAHARDKAMQVFGFSSDHVSFDAPRSAPENSIVEASYVQTACHLGRVLSRSLIVQG